MAITLPAAPENFYSPSLNELKTKLLTKNGSSIGRVALLTSAPSSMGGTLWSELGAAWDSNQNGYGENRGSYVVGHADIGSIAGPVLGPVESGGEAGYKLQFGEVKDIPVFINGSGTATATVVGIALLEGVDTYAIGSYANVRYIIKVADLVVTDSKKITLPAFEVIINYSEIDTGI